MALSAVLFSLLASLSPIVDPTPPKPWLIKRPSTRCDHDPRLLNEPPPEYPEVSRDLGLGEVMVVLKVFIDEHGHLKAAQIFKSSGDRAVDVAAMRLAHESTYAPAKQKCRPVGGTLLFPVDFNPGG